MKMDLHKKKINMKMGFEILLSVLLIALYHLQYGDGQTLSIKDFLSDSNETNVDHSQAFQAAWQALCQGKGRSIVIQASETYTIQPQVFQGPCASSNLHIQIDGTLEAPATVKEWGAKQRDCWLCFEKVADLSFTGSGLLNAHGESWWSSVSASSRPEALRFSGCQNLLYSGLTQRNSPKNHISIINCNNATLSNLHIIAPENSPNTDGIDINLSRNIYISGSSIETGDDCIAINGGSSEINITSVTCGPGHGISIGSLGAGGRSEMVQDVNVRHCTFTGTQNGARIKTWIGGSGYAKNILYENITLINAKFPIIIDQKYTNNYYNSLAKGNAVKVSDVTFRYFRGTCANDVAIKLDCDSSVGCDNIVMDHINITSSSGTPLTAYCQFAHVISSFVSIIIKCGFRKVAQLLSPCIASSAPQAQPPAPTAQPQQFFPLPYMF